MNRNPDEMFDIAQSMKEAAEERKENRMIIEQMANVRVWVHHLNSLFVV